MGRKLGIAESFLVAAELRSGGVITEQEILALKKRWSRSGPAQNGGTRYSEVERFTRHAPYLISTEQTAKGLAWWRANTIKLDGSWRQNKFTDSLDQTNTYIISCFARFELVDWQEEYRNHEVSHYSPIYRMIATTGDSFEYVGRSWQSGGVEFV